MKDQFVRKDAMRLRDFVTCGCMMCMGKAKHNFAASGDDVKLLLRLEFTDIYKSLRNREIEEWR